MLPIPILVCFGTFISPFVRRRTAGSDLPPTGTIPRWGIPIFQAPADHVACSRSVSRSLQLGWPSLGTPRQEDEAVRQQARSVASENAQSGYDVFVAGIIARASSSLSSSRATIRPGHVLHPPRLSEAILRRLRCTSIKPKCTESRKRTARSTWGPASATASGDVSG